MGRDVRYDGSNKYQPQLIAELSKWFELLPVCPEQDAGLGVPRPPVQLVQIDNEVHALGVEDASLDVTGALLQYAQRLLPELQTLSGFVFKARSPSCGIASTPLFDLNGSELEKRGGLFAAFVRTHFPDLPMAEEEELLNEMGISEFIERVKRYA